MRCEFRQENETRNINVRQADVGCTNESIKHYINIIKSVETIEVIALIWNIPWLGLNLTERYTMYQIVLFGCFICLDLCLNSSPDSGSERLYFGWKLSLYTNKHPDECHYLSSLHPHVSHRPWLRPFKNKLKCLQNKKQFTVSLIYLCWYFDLVGLF